LFGQEGVLNKMCSTQFLLNTCTFFQARILLDQCLALRHILDQLFRHLIELRFQLPDFVLPADRHSLRVIAICKLCRGTHQALEASYQASCCQHTKEGANRCRDDDPEQSSKEQKLYIREDVSIESWRRPLYINR